MESSKSHAGVVTADNLRGAILLALAAVLFTLEATLVRATAPVANEAQIVFFRSASQLALSLVIIWRIGDWGRLATSRPGLHIIRGLTSLTMWWLYYTSFRMLDLALATTLTFTTSLFVVALAAPLLGEHVGRVRWAATIIGFVGIAIAVGPAADVSVTGVSIGLVAAAGGAAIVILNRLLGFGGDLLPDRVDLGQFRARFSHSVLSSVRLRLHHISRYPQIQTRSRKDHGDE